MIVALFVGIVAGRRHLEIDSNRYVLRARKRFHVVATACRGVPGVDGRGPVSPQQPEKRSAAAERYQARAADCAWQRHEAAADALRTRRGAPRDETPTGQNHPQCGIFFIKQKTAYEIST